MAKRREFIKQTFMGSAGLVIGGMGFKPKSYASIIGFNDCLTVAITGIHT